MTTFQEGRAVADGNVGPLEHDKGTGLPESCIHKPTLQRGHRSVQGDQELEVGQEGQCDHRSRCIHNYPGGVGCYVRDTRHLYRLKQEVCQ